MIQILGEDNRQDKQNLQDHTRTSTQDMPLREYGGSSVEMPIPDEEIDRTEMADTDPPTVRNWVKTINSTV